MSDIPYANRELDEKFNDIKASLDRIEVQTRKTNGRVDKLEAWRWFLGGGLAILSFIVVVSAAIITVIIQTHAV